MTSPRAALTRQNLTKLLGELRAQGVSEAEFHADGRLSAVRFGPLDEPEEAGKRGKVITPEPSRWAATRAAVAVAQGKDDAEFGGEG